MGHGSMIKFTILGEPASTRITYIYALTDNDMSIRYIGKSDFPFRRFKCHLKDPLDTHKTRWIKSLAKIGQIPLIKILEIVPLKEWKTSEQKWINIAKSNGANLTNSTDGGDGLFNPSVETLRKMRDAKKGGKLTHDHKQKVSSSLKGRRKPKRTEEHISNLSKSLRGRIITLDHREKLAFANMKRKVISSSGYRGVYYCQSRQKYECYITIDKKKKLIGRFDSAIDAAKEFNKTAMLHEWPAEGLNKI